MKVKDRSKTVVGIMCAGRGTRFQDSVDKLDIRYDTEHINKCVVDLGGAVKSPLQTTMDNFIELGYRKFMIATGYNYYSVERFLEGNYDSQDLEITIVPVTGGGVLGSLVSLLELLKAFDTHYVIESKGGYITDIDLVVTEGDFVLRRDILDKFLDSGKFTACLPSIKDTKNTLLKLDDSGKLLNIYYDSKHKGEVGYYTNESLQIWRLSSVNARKLVDISSKIDSEIYTMSNIELYNGLMTQVDLDAYIVEDSYDLYYNCNTIQQVIEMNIDWNQADYNMLSEFMKPILSLDMHIGKKVYCKEDSLLMMKYYLGSIEYEDLPSHLKEVIDSRGYANIERVEASCKIIPFNGYITSKEYIDRVIGEPNPDNLPTSDLSIYSTISMKSAPELENYVSKIATNDFGKYYLVYVDDIPYLIGLIPVDYLRSSCRIHEETIPKKVESCTEYFKSIHYNSSPIMLAFDSKHSNLDLDSFRREEDGRSLYNGYVRSSYPCSELEVYKINSSYNEVIESTLEGITKMYILDGHHRTKSYINSGTEYALVAITSSDNVFMEGYYHGVNMTSKVFDKVLRDNPEYAIEYTTEILSDSKYLQFQYMNSDGRYRCGRIISMKSQDDTYEDILNSLNLSSDSSSISHGLLSRLLGSQSLNSLALIPSSPTMTEMMYKLDRGEIYKPKSTAVSFKVPSGIFHQFIY